MQITRLTLENFRQFYGRQVLDLATDKDRNVTLIHAENGVGKTTLLNAILWALFGQTTPRFEQKDKLVNFTALAEHKRTGGVQVEFEHGDLMYRVDRQVTQTGRGTTHHFGAFRIDAGASKALNVPEEFVNSVIPAEMARYFFFDGEAAETFSGEANAREVGKAIRAILGCDLAETAVEDLRFLGREVEKRLGDIPEADDLRCLEEELEDLRAKKETLEAALASGAIAVQALQAQQEEIVKQLRGAEAARELQMTRDEKERYLATVQGSLARLDEELLRWIGQRAIQVTGRRLAQETLEFINEEELRGRIPSPYNEDFVRGLLESATCVCQRPLTPQSREWQAVSALLRDAGNAELLGRVVRARTRGQQFREGALQANAELERNKSGRRGLEEERLRLEQEIAEISRKIAGLPLEEIARREDARRAVGKRIESESARLGQLRQQIQLADSLIAGKEREIRAVGSKFKQAQRLLRRVDLTGRAATLLQGLLRSYESDAREKIQEKINSLLEEFARRHYTCRLEEDFELSLLYSADGVSAPKSGGENQLLGLAFISALVRFAIERSDAKRHILVPGTVAPLVLDSPFGHLDKEYRKSTASFVPRLADQVILLVSSSQGDESVLDALDGHVGAEFVLISENRGPRGRKSEDAVRLNGKTYMQSQFEKDRDLTRLVRVR